MNKTSIKVIKRKDASVAAGVQIRNLREAKQAASAFGEENTERRLRRKMADTVSNWIAERRENKRSEEISAFRKLFGDEFLSGTA
jgi:hypothetical protein